jgi:membrane protein
MLQWAHGMRYTEGMAFRESFLRQFGRTFAATGRVMLKNEAPRDAASISYFSLIALFPAILVIVYLADAFLGWMDLHGIVVELILGLFPGSNIFLHSSLNELTNPSVAVVLSCTFVFIWSSSWIFTFLESAINRAWDTLHQKTFWESRLRSIAFMMLGGSSLLATAVITASVSNARARTVPEIPSSAEASSLIGWLWSFFLLGAGLLIAVLVFALIFKWIPHRRVFWREAFSGAVVFIFMWEISSIIFVWLLPYFDYQRIYGRTGAVIALLVWVYTSNLILLFGANFSAQLHSMRLQSPGPHAGTFPGEKLRSFPSRQ